MGNHFFLLFHRKKSTKGQFCLQGIILSEETRAGVCVSRPIPLSREKLLKWLLKAFGSQNGPFYPLSRWLVKIFATFEVAMLCAVADA